MVDRLQYQPPSIYTERSREVSYDDGTVQYMSQLSGAFLSVANKAGQAELRSNLEQAQKDGVIAGLEQGENFKPSKRGGIVHRTYNDSAIQTATVGITSKTQAEIQRVSAMNPGNPAAQGKLLQEWADKFAAGLDNDLVAPFRSNFNTLATAQITAANKEFAKIRQSEAIANFNEFEGNLTNTIEQFAPNMFEAGAVGGDSAKAVEKLRQNYVEMLAQNGPGAEYSVAGYRIPEGTGRSGAFSVEEIGKKLEEFDKMALSSGIKGNFLRELENGRGVENYLNFVKGDTALTVVDEQGNAKQLSIDSMFKDDEKEKIAGFMRTHIKTLNSLDEAAEKKLDRARDRYNENLMDSAVAGSLKTITTPEGKQIVQGDPEALHAVYLAAVNDDTGLVKLDTIKDLQALKETIGNGDVADPTVVSATTLDIIEGDIRSPARLPKAGLGDKARGEAYQLIRQINAGQHWSSSKRYTSMIDLAKDSLAPEAAIGFNFGNPNAQSASDLAEFKETLANDIIAAEKAGTLPADINALPIEGEFDIQQRGQEIIKQIRERRKQGEQDPEIVELNAQIKTLNDKLNDDAISDDEAEKARDELKKATDRKIRLQSNKQLGL